MSSQSTQIVITGTGLVTPLGDSVESTWRAVLEGRCGMGPMPAMESPLPADADGGQAVDLPADYHPDLPREARYLRYTVEQAVRDAGIDRQLPYASDRCGIILGTTLHGVRAAGRYLRSKDWTFLKDFLSGAVLSSASPQLPFEGCAMTTCSACSSSLGAIALGISMLRAGELDLVVAGGYDTISEYVYGGFNSLRLVAKGPLRPFTRGREGMKLAEGYGIVVLECAVEARQRGKSAVVTVMGYGESADAHHLTQPHPEGQGAARAIDQALRDAKVGTDEIGLVAAHATGTPDNDAGEFAALSRVFGKRLPEVPVVAFKSHLGHTLGGAGAVELILSAMALRDQVIPACANVHDEDLEFPGLNVATGKPRPHPIHYTLNTSLGFGGANTCMVLGRASLANAPSVAQPPPAVFRRPAEGSTAHEVLVSGIGIVLPGTIGADAFVRLIADSPRPPEKDRGPVPESDYISLLNARRVRRMSDYVKLSLAATVLALKDAGVEDTATFAESCAAILGTTHGSTGYSEPYYGQIVTEGVQAANPMLFAEGVPNAAAAHLSLMLSLKGPCQTVIGTRTAGLDALRIASVRIASGEWDRAIVGAAEEYSPTVNAAYARWGLYGNNGFATGAGAVTFVLESRAHTEARRARPRGHILDAAGSMVPARSAARLIRHVLNRFGQTDTLIGSANHTWIDRVESMGTRSSSQTNWSPYPVTAECFSVLPLAGLAAGLLCEQRFAPRFVSIATDYAGSVGGVLIERINP